ncbi:MAG: hypothetical protein WA634_12135 [Silvibacterium sp.]
MKAQACTSLLAAFTFAVLTPLTAFAQPASLDQPHYSHRQLQQLIRDAHTPEQYRALAAWFRSQEKAFNDKAAVEKQEWDRRKAMTASPALKYPTPADSAHNLYDYYLAKAHDMALRASDYEQRAR